MRRVAELFRDRTNWLWSAALLVLAAVIGGFWVLSQAARQAPLPHRFEAAAESLESSSLAVVLADDEERLELIGNAAQFVVLAPDASPTDALRAFQTGQGRFFGQRAILSLDGADPRPGSLYVRFSYRTTGSDPVFFRYRSFSPLFSAVWLSDAAGKTFDLIGLAGPEAPWHRSPVSGQQETVSPLLLWLSLPASPTQTRHVLVRVDSIFPYWSSFTLYARYAFEHQRYVTGYMDGIFLGASVVAMGFALYGLYRRQTMDYLTFLLATICIAFWYLIQGEHVVGSEWVLLRRMALAAPVHGYFLLHGVGLMRLLYPPEHRRRHELVQWRCLPLWLALAYTGLGLAGATLYGMCGMSMPGANWLEMWNDWLFVVAPALLLIGTLLAPSRKLPGYLLLIAVELVGAAGAVLQFVHANTPWLDSTVAEVLIKYPLPVEVLIWAAALSSRFHYLEMVAKRRVKAALRREAARVREAMRANVESRQHALDTLDQSYRAADRARAAMLGIIDTHAHAVNNLLMRLGGHLEALGRLSAAEQPQRLAAASGVVDQLAMSVDDAEAACRNAKTLQHAPALASSLLTWQVDAAREPLAARRVTVQLTLGPEGKQAWVDGYHFMEAGRELLSNACRYASSDSIVNVDLAADENQVSLTVRNTGDLREDDQALRLGRPVAPAPSTHNGEISSGRGLATLHALLATIGGSVRYEGRIPDDVIVRAVFPRR